MTTEFKPGDRVRGASHLADNPHRRIYEGVLRTRGTLTAAVDTDNEGLQYVYTETLQAIDPYTPKVGDKVRVVHEGVVTHVYKPDGAFDIDSDTYVTSSLAKTVELLEKAPEPFAVGTVVHSRFGQIAFKTRTGWVLDTGDRSALGDDWFRQSHVEILHEPPTS